MDFYYIKIFCILGIIVCSILSLDYLLKFIIYSYFKKDVDVIIPNKLPKMVYNYLNDLKILSKLEESSHRFFLMNFILYFVILCILIFILILI